MCHPCISSKTVGVYGRLIVPPAPRPPLPGSRPLTIWVTLCHRSAGIPCPQRPGRWPPGKVGAGSRCVLGEDGPVWNWWDIHQLITDNLDGREVGSQVKGNTTSKETKSFVSGTFCVMTNWANCWEILTWESVRPTMGDSKETRKFHTWVKTVRGLDYTHLHWVRVDARSIQQELDPPLCELTILCFWCIVSMLQWHVVVGHVLLCSPMHVQCMSGVNNCKMAIMKNELVTYKANMQYISKLLCRYLYHPTSVSQAA